MKTYSELQVADLQWLRTDFFPRNYTAASTGLHCDFHAASLSFHGATPDFHAPTPGLQGDAQRFWGPRQRII